MRRLLPENSKLLYGVSTVVSDVPGSLFRPTQVRYIRNLHRNKQERNKSLVKDRHHYSKKWYLLLGANYELNELKGHEREAFDNFFKYRFDSSKPNIIKFVDKPEEMPPRKRYDYYFSTIDGRKGLPAFIKCKYSIKALEAFIDMKNIKDIPANYEEWSSREQDHFLWLVDTVISEGRNCLSRHHSVVAMAIRASAIADELRCYEKRDSALNAAENMANRMDAHFAYNKPEHATINLNLQGQCPRWEIHLKKIFELQKLGKVNNGDKELPKFIKKPGRKMVFPLKHYQRVVREGKRSTYLNQFNQPYISID